MTTCRLCLREVEALANSHILPEFLYKPLYDEKHRCWVLSSTGKEPVHPIQKGLREPLLCYECDNTYLGSLEGYVRDFLLSGPKTVGHTYTQSRERIELQGCDYKKLRLFQMSILWRAGVSSLPPFAKVQLDDHEERLRTMLDARDPGDPEEYPCVIFGLTRDGVPLDGLIIPSFRFQLDGYEAWGFLMGACLWAHFVSLRVTSSTLSEGFMQRSGKLVIPYGDYRRLPFLTDLLRDFADANPDWTG